MKKLILCFIVSASLVACSTPATTTETATATVQSDTLDKAAVAEKLKGMEAAWNLSALEADHGVKVVSEILADDFHQFNSKGEIQNRDQVLKAAAESTETTTEVINGDMNVTFFGNNVATVIGSHVTNGKDKSGKAFSKTTVWNDTYMEREGKWQCIASGSTTVVPEKK